MSKGHDAGDGDGRDARGVSPARPVRKVRTTAGLGSGGLSPMPGKPVEKRYGGRRAMLRRQAEEELADG